MNPQLKHRIQLLLAIILLCTVWGRVHAQQLPPVDDVNIDDGRLTWSGMAYITRRCSDVGTGESCVARCPDFVVEGGYFLRSATGGSCSSSDSININSSIDSDRYTCSVSTFTANVEAKVACLISE